MNDIDNLDNEIFVAQLEGRFNSIKLNERKHTISAIKRMILMFGPYITSIVVSLIFKLPIVLISGSIYFITLSIIEVIKENKKFNNYLKVRYGGHLNKDYKLYKSSDFYTKAIKIELEKERMYSDNCIDKYTSKLDEIRALKEVKCYLDKESAIKKLNEDINLYYFAYKIPAFDETVSFEDFYNQIYDYLKLNNRQKDFYNIMSRILKYTFSISLVYELDSIDIETLVDCIDYSINDSKDNRVKLKKKILKSYCKKNCKSKKILAKKS